MAVEILGQGEPPRTWQGRVKQIEDEFLPRLQLDASGRMVQSMLASMQVCMVEMLAQIADKMGCEPPQGKP